MWHLFFCGIINSESKRYSLWLRPRAVEIWNTIQAGIGEDNFSLSAQLVPPKNETTWRGISVEYLLSKYIQPQEYSRGGGLDGISRINGSVWVNSNGNRNVAYLNRDGDERNLNLNWDDDNWNDNCRFLAVSQYFHFLSRLIRGSFCFK